MRSRLLQTTGLLASFLALFLMLGGHWALLQTVAWARMLRDYSNAGSFTEAIEKTFDGRHPCKMCLKIRKARQEERRQPPTWLLEKQPEFCIENRPGTVPLPPVFAGHEVAFVPRLHPGINRVPPKPPPRAV